MQEKAYEMTLLFDFYGGLLTEKQRHYFDRYYNEDLSLAEIAELEGISRQGVRDLIVRASLTLQDTEDKLGFVKRHIRQSSVLDQLESILKKLKEYPAHEVQGLAEDAYIELQLLKE